MTPATRSKQVLVLLPSQQDYKELALLEEEGYKFEYFDDEYWRSYEPAFKEFDPVDYIRRCVARARVIGAKGIFYTDDLANFAAAVVAQNVGLPAPSPETMFRANHKFYSREVEPDPIRFAGFSLASNAWRRPLQFPVHVKPVSLFFSLLQTTVWSEHELEAAVEKLRAGVPEWERPFQDLFSRYIDKKKFPLAGSHSFVVEEFVQDAASQHAVEGWTDAEGRHFIWAVSDNNYWPGTAAPLDNNSVPTRLNTDVTTALCEVATNTMERFGFKNGFWNVEIWVRSDGRIQVTEVNGRVCASMTPLYRAVFRKSQYPAAVKLACGLPVDASDMPEPAVGVGAMFAIAATRQGYVRDLICLENFEKAAQMSGVVKTSLIYPPETLISWGQTGGRCCLARAWIVGRDHQEIAEKADEIRRSVLDESNGPRICS